MVLRKGQVVSVRFLDHVEEGPNAHEFVVHGRIVNVTKVSITIRCWEYASEPLCNHDANTVQYVLVRGAIRHITHWTPI